MDKVDNGMCYLSALHLVNKWELDQVFHPITGFETRGPFIPIFVLLCANILSISLTQAESSNKLKGVKVGRSCISFTHLLFANDSFLFFKKDDHSLDTLQKILEWYCIVLGQCINLSKSDLYWSPNMPIEEQEALAQTLKVIWYKILASTLESISSWGVTNWLVFNFWLKNLTPNYKDGKQSFYHKQEEQLSYLLSYNPYPHILSHVLEFLSRYATRWMP